MTDEQAAAGGDDTLTEDEKIRVTAWLDEVNAHVRRLQLEREERIRAATCCAPGPGNGVVDRAAALEQAMTTGAAYWKPNQNVTEVLAASDAAEKGQTGAPGDPVDDMTDAEVFAALAAAISVEVVDPAGLQRRIVTWLAEAGHGEAASALGEVDIDTLMASH